MKKLILFGIVAITIFSCNKKEEFYEIRLTASENTIGAVEGATVILYNTYEDYLLKKNAVASGQTDANGSYNYRHPSNYKYYFSVEKGNLNNIRDNQIHSDSTGYTNPSYTMEKKNRINYILVRVNLNTTPTRLQLNVKESGIAVANATVRLYKSEEYYNIDSYRFEATTDAAGAVLFTDLEPQEYWIKVKKSGSFTFNPGSPNKTGVLPDDANITTVLDIGI